MGPGITRTKVPARTSSYFRSDLAYALWKVSATPGVMRVGHSSTEKSLTLTSAKCGFDAFVTVDGGLPYQRDLSLFDLAVVVLEANSNDIEDPALGGRGAALGALWRGGPRSEKPGEPPEVW